VLRDLLTPRYLALVVLAMVFAVGFVALGRWQWHVAHGAPVTTSPSTAPVVPLTSLVLPRAPVPGTDVSRLVTVTGRYDASGQLVVPARTVRGVPAGPDDGPVGVWVLAPLRTADDVVVPVVRGWAASPADAAPPPAGEVTVTGRLYASEDSALRNPDAGVLPAGQIDIVSGAELVSRWSGDLIDGFVAAAKEQPGSGTLQPVTPPMPVGNAGFHLRNAVYAVQWWCFAAFVLFFAYRVIRDESRRRPGEAAEQTAVPLP
jgi:cytochrome oxidase assembly protein ShyY1